MLILFIEENAQDYLKYRQLLDDQADKFNMDWAPNYEVALNKIENNAYDIYLVGYYETKVQQQNFLVWLYTHVNKPTILLTKHSEQVNIELMEKYLSYSLGKEQLSWEQLNRAIRYHARLLTLQKNEDKFQSIFENALAFIGIISLEGIVQEFNKTALTLFDIQKSPTTGIILWDMVWVKNSQTELKAAFAEAKKGKITHSQVALQKSNGQVVTLDLSLTRHKDVILLEGHDISGSHALEQQLAQTNLHDQLTELPNRHLFMEYLEKAIVHTQSHKNSNLAVLVISLEKFKSINATLGHDMGDWLMMEITQRLQGCLQKKELLARARGDEFLILQHDMQDFSEATTLATIIINTLEYPFSLTNYEFVISCHIGIAYYRDQNEETDLLRDADAAMYHAKSKGNSYAVFRPSMYETVISRLQMETDVLRATKEKNNNFVLFYQPTIELSTEQLVGMESMIHFQHPQHGVISQLEFMPVLEETGFIISIGEWNLRTACHQLFSWLETALFVHHVSVNLSTRHFQNKNLIKTVIESIEQNGLKPDCLELMINESLLLEHGDMALKTLKHFKDVGINITINDFGMGYASLNCLRHFPADCLKINSSIINGIISSPEDSAITVATIDMAHALGLTVIAEGVETLEQRDFLREQGCDFAQGYFYAAPMKNMEAQTWAKQYTSTDT